MSADVHVVELIPAYALGCLDEDEAGLVSQHLSTCLSCQTELRVYQAVVEQLALAAPGVTPPPVLKNRLLARISSTLPAPRSSLPWQRQFLQRLRQFLTPAWGAAALFLVLALVFGSLWLRQQITPAQKAIGPEGMQALSLTSTEVVPGASGFIIISADGRNGALVLDRLPQLDPAQQYQLWLVRDGQRTSGAVLSVDQSGYGGTRVVAPEPLFSYSSAEVTIEPAGGSPTPTGDPILWVSLQ